MLCLCSSVRYYTVTAEQQSIVYGSATSSADSQTRGQTGRIVICEESFM